MIGHLYTLLLRRTAGAPAPSPAPSPTPAPGAGGGGGPFYPRAKPRAVARPPMYVSPLPRHTRRQRRVAALLVAGAI